MAIVEIRVGGLTMTNSFENVSEARAQKVFTAAFRRLLTENDPEPKPDLSVRILARGEKFIELIKEVRHVTGYGLKEAKEIADSLPKTLGPFPDHIARKFLNACLATGADAVIVK